MDTIRWPWIRFPEATITTGQATDFEQRQQSLTAYIQHVFGTLLKQMLTGRAIAVRRSEIRQVRFVQETV